MNDIAAITILKQFNRWRRGDDEVDWTPQDSNAVGEAIDHLIDLVKTQSAQITKLEKDIEILKIVASRWKDEVPKVMLDILEIPLVD